MTDSVPSTPPPPALPNVFARAIGVITSPKAMFERVVQTPRTVGILFLVALVSWAATTAFTLTEKGRQAQVDFSVQQAERFGMTVDDAAYARIEAQSKFAVYTGLIGMFVGFPVILLIVSGVLYAIFNAIMGGTADFKQVMAVAAHAWVVPTLGAVFAGILNFMRGSIQQSVANLGMLLPMLPERSFVANLAGAVDLFQIWFLTTLSIGLGVLYKKKTSSIASVLFVLYAVIAIGFSYFLRKG